jgi:hypothetical protein
MDLKRKVYRDISNDNAKQNNSIDYHQLSNEGMLIHFHRMIRHLPLDKDVQEDNNDKPNNENFGHHILQNKNFISTFTKDFHTNLNISYIIAIHFDKDRD